MKIDRLKMHAPACCGLVLALACQLACQPPGETPEPTTVPTASEDNAIQDRLAKYTPFALTTDLERLSDRERQMIPLLIAAAQAMDDAFWLQAYGDKDALLGSIADPDVRAYAEINYGPWDRLEDDEPFVDGVGPKPAGANFYPADATQDEIQRAADANPDLLGLYTVVRRDDAGQLIAVPYSEAYAAQYAVAAESLRAAAELADDDGLRSYLRRRADALLSDQYYDSDLAWMDMKTNVLDIVIGPIETYEDKLFGAKASNESYVLVKDVEWSDRLSRYASLLPDLQRGLPVADPYKQEMPGTDSDLNAYDVVYYAGDCNAGSKTIAINLPNDEKVGAAKGTRRLQLKNAMRAKFDKILLPLTRHLLVEEQQSQVTFDAFFANTMFHEVAHGLGISSTITGKGTVREALREQSSALEEGKADVLGLYMVTRLHEQGEIGDAPLEDYATTFLGSIFRSIRFGSASAHGVANLIRFNFFHELGAFTRGEDGRYRVDYVKMREAVDALSERILTLQGDGDYDAVVAFVEQYGQEGDTLRADLDGLSAAGIPVDVTFEQGTEVLGLEH